MHPTAELTHTTQFSLLWLIPVLPLMGAAINGIFGKKLQDRYGKSLNHAIAIALPTGSFIIALVAFIKMMGLDEHSRVVSQNLFPFLHVGLLDADLAFWFDPLSGVMALIITVIGTLIHVYSIGYMADEKSNWRFFAYLNLFMASMLTLVLGDNLLVMFIGWEGVGLCSYLLISFWYTENANAVAGNKAFIVNRIGDFGFIIGMALLFWGMMGGYSGTLGAGSDSYEAGYWKAAADHQTAHISNIEAEELCKQYGGCSGAMETTAGRTLAQRFNAPRQAPPTSLRFDAMRARIGADKEAWAENSINTKTFMGVPLIILVCVFLFIGACGKSAQIPLYVWLPDAMAGPTPVSALIHAATMVTAGVYMVARCNFLFSISPTAMTVVAVVGAITALYAATIGLFQYDIKKVLAYSTVSQLGYMFIGVGVGAYWAGTYHLLTHAVFKALLFLGSGSVILGCHHNQDMRKMGGLKKYMPLTHWTYFAGCIAITTAPVFLLSNGFFSKDEILWKAFSANHLLIPGWSIWLMGFIGAGLTSFYMWRSYYMTFTGEYRGDMGHGHGDHADDHADDHGHHGGEPHESPRSMTWVLVTLAALIIPTAVLGMWPLIFHNEPLFEQLLHPVVGAATASLDWMHSLMVEHILAWSSVAFAMVSWLAARAMYKDAKSEVPARLLANESGMLRVPYKIIYNKYYVDEIYDWAIVRRSRQLSQILFWFDQKIIDGLVNLTGFLGRMVSAVDGLIDSLVVDGMVNGVAGLFGAVGNRLRRLQTGQIQTYLAGAIVGALLLVLVNFALFF